MQPGSGEPRRAPPGSAAFGAIAGAGAAGVGFVVWETWRLARHGVGLRQAIAATFGAYARLVLAVAILAFLGVTTLQ